MEKIHVLNTFIKMFVISFFIFLTYEKITGYKSSKQCYVIILFTSMVISMSYVIISMYLLPLITLMFLYIIYGLIINKIVEDKINYIAYIYSCVIAYIIYLLAIIITGIILFVVSSKREQATPIASLIISFITSMLYLCIFKLKRFKNGFNFLKKKSIDKKIRNFAVFWTGIIILIFGFSQKTNNMLLGSCIFIGAILIVISIVIWIKSQITKTYKNRMRDRTIEMQKAEIDEQARIIEEIKAENLKLATAVHKYNKKFSSLEFAMKNALELETKTEFANEISTILEEYQEASKNFAKEVQVNKNKLPITSFVGIDNMFKYMQEEAIQNSINFDLKINEKINLLVDNIISKDKFETLIGDHLKDAIIAVKASDEAYKSILVTLGLVDGNYEFSVYDTGVEFEIDTLLKLGKEQVTTHKDEGGSGIGFMTTFETLKECKASLVIEEYNPEATNYTKSVTIKFDGKNEYRIYSYRAEKIKKQKPERRIIIKKLK